MTLIRLDYSKEFNGAGEIIRRYLSFFQGIHFPNQQGEGGRSIFYSRDKLQNLDGLLKSLKGLEGISGVKLE